MLGFALLRWPSLRLPLVRSVHSSVPYGKRPNDGDDTKRPLMHFAERLAATAASKRPSAVPTLNFPSTQLSQHTRGLPVLSGRALLQQKIQERIKERLFNVRNEDSQERAPRDEEIKSAMITLISSEGVVQGTQPLARVLHEMDRKQDTLVLVDGHQDPPACRIFSRKLIYERERMARKAAQKTAPRPQTIVMGESIETRDLHIKVEKVKAMLAKGKRVTVVVESKGRQRSAEKRAQVGEHVLESLKPHATACALPVVEPNSWSVALQGKKVAL